MRGISQPSALSFQCNDLRGKVFSNFSGKNKNGPSVVFHKIISHHHHLVLVSPNLNDFSSPTTNDSRTLEDASIWRGRGKGDRDR